MGTISKLNEISIANVAKVGGTVTASIGTIGGETPGGASGTVNWTVEAYNISGGVWNGSVFQWGIDWTAGGGNLPITNGTAVYDALWPNGTIALFGYGTGAWPNNGFIQMDPFAGSASAAGYINNAPGIGPPTSIGTLTLTTNGPWTTAVGSAGFVNGVGSPIPMEIYVAGVSVYADPSPQVLIGVTQIP